MRIEVDFDADILKVTSMLNDIDKLLKLEDLFRSAFLWEMCKVADDAEVLTQLE